MNALKQFLEENLPEKFQLNEGETITDVLVLVRIADLNSEGGLPERYEYTTSIGLGFATARGMIQCTHEQMINLYQQVIDLSQGEDDG